MSSTPSSIGGAQPPLRSALKSEEDGDRSSPANASFKGTYIFPIFQQESLNILNLIPQTEVIA